MYASSTILLVATAVVISSTAVAAFDTPKRFLNKIDLNGGSDNAKLNQFETLNSLHEGRFLADGQCPVCPDSNDDVGAIQKALSKITQGNLGRGKVFTLLKKTLLKGRQRQMNKQISVDTVVTTLTTAESHFAAVAQGSRDLKANNETSTATVGLLNVLEGVATVTSNLMSQINSNVVGTSDTKTVGLIVNVIVSILNLIQSVILGVISIFVNFLRALTGTAATFDKNSVQVTSVVDVLSGKNGIFADILSVLEAEKDTSGLAAVLVNSTSAMAGVGDQLTAFLSQTDGALTKSSKASTAVSGNTINEILALITNLITSILNLIVSIITTIINLIVGIIRAIISLIVGIIQAIINLIVSILNAILGIFSGRSASTAKAASTESGDSLDGMVLLIFQSLLCVVGRTCKQAKCHKEALQCQNDALSVAIPSV